MKLIRGVVTSNADITKSGTFLCTIGSNLGFGEPLSVEVTYVSPYMHKDAGFISIPLPGSQVLIAEVTEEDDNIEPGRAFYYMGSILTPKETSITRDDSTIFGDRVRVLPDEFLDMYDAKDAAPEKRGFTSPGGAAFLMSEQFIGRSRGYQNYEIEMKSGAGKSFKHVDSPIVDATIWSNGSHGRDFIAFSRGGHDKSTLSEGEIIAVTHGPINLITTESNMKLWVVDGRNLEIINEATGAHSPSGDRSKVSSGGGSSWTEQFKEGQDHPDTSNPAHGDPHDFGNEDFGCVTIKSLHNNIVLEALAEDSVVRIVAPGENSKVVIVTNGTIDMEAAKKITISSGEEIELNAPNIDINGTNRVDIN